MRYMKHEKYYIDLNQNKDKLEKIISYAMLTREKKLKKKAYKDALLNPKVTLIATVFNKYNYLFSLITSIQNQKLKEFELICIDDYSTDKSINIINDFSRIDKRIKLIKNKKNRGTLYSRAQGALFSKGEYIIFIDGDDLLLKDGLYNAYNYISMNNLSIIQFNTAFQGKDKYFINQRDHIYRKVITQPVLSYIFYYNFNLGKGDEQNTALWDKLILREIVIKSLKYIGKEYISKKIRIENDVILLFSIFQNSVSYQYINEIVYFYFKTNQDSISNSWKNPKIADKIIKSLFINIDFLYSKTNKTFLDKYYSIFKVKQAFERYKPCFEFMKTQNKFMKKIFNKLLNSKYISNSDKIDIANIELSIISLSNK